MSPSRSATVQSQLARRHDQSVKQRPLREAVRVDPVAEAILRGGVALGLVAVALIHFLDLFSKLDETPYLGVAYLGLIAASLVVAGQLVTAGRPGLWLAAAGLAGITICGYILSRAVGLPSATGDIGNWKEPLGLASVFVEALVLVVSVYAITRSALGPRSSEHLAAAQDR